MASTCKNQRLREEVTGLLRLYPSIARIRLFFEPGPHEVWFAALSGENVLWLQYQINPLSRDPGSLTCRMAELSNDEFDEFIHDFFSPSEREDTADKTWRRYAVEPQDIQLAVSIHAYPVVSLLRECLGTIEGRLALMEEVRAEGGTFNRPAEARLLAHRFRGFVNETEAPLRRVFGLTR